MRLFAAQLHQIEVDECHIRCKDRAKQENAAVHWKQALELNQTSTPEVAALPCAAYCHVFESH